MRWRKSFGPVAMRRVALLAPARSARAVLVEVADVGAVQFDSAPRLDGSTRGDGTMPRDDVEGPATRLLRQRRVTAAAPLLSAEPPDLGWCEANGRLDLITGEARLEAVVSSGVPHQDVIGFLGWAPADHVATVRERVAPVGGAMVALRRPAHLQPPTLLSVDSAGRPFTPLVRAYATPPYRDIDPSLLAGVTYVAMFGMMFADLGHGALLLAAALYLRAAHSRRLERFRSAWVFLAGAGLASMLFGVLYGEFFGPTHLLPVVWLSPLDQPVPLLLAAIAIGATLLAIAYGVGIVNRFREGGWRLAAYAPSGLAGAGTFLGLGLLSAGVYTKYTPLTVAGVCLVGISAGLVTAGFFAEAGGGGVGVAQAGIELLDLLLRIGSNVVSFARLAAFGLTHAALCQVVWQAATGSARHGAIGVTAAVLVFALGNALAFALESLIAGVQALRLEYYELFSRIFLTEGEPFRPWALPVSRANVVESRLEA